MIVVLYADLVLIYELNNIWAVISCVCTIFEELM